VLTGISLPEEAKIGPGLRIHHAGPVVVHSDVVIGASCVLRHDVTLGERGGKGAPRLGDDVDVGAYAQVLGPVQVGAGARIGALALVLHDVPAHGVAYAPVAVVVERAAPARAHCPVTALARAARAGADASCS